MAKIFTFTAELKSFIVLYDGKFIRAYHEAEVDEAIAELKQENKCLTKRLEEYDSRQRIDERIKFNSVLLIRKLKRALWLARAEMLRCIIISLKPILTKMRLPHINEKRTDGKG